MNDNVSISHYARACNNDGLRREGEEPDEGALEKIARDVALSCGYGKLLDIGRGDDRLTREFVGMGMDAVGIDVSQNLIQKTNSRFPGRFEHASVIDLPFADGEFDTVVSIHCLEYIELSDVSAALREMHRVADRYVFLRIATLSEGDSSSIAQGRAWWERQCLEIGFRKHPAYYLLIDYESLNNEEGSIYIPLEKIPKTALATYPLHKLADERDLHMDMLREVGERSDAHVVRYEWALTFIRQGARVLDAACGLGYGSYLLGQRSLCASVMGIDGSEFAIDYARSNFAAVDNKLSFKQGLLPQCLSQFEEGSFDVVISFETLEHVEYPEALLAEFERILAPCGRVIVSVPNDWSDETGKDPNPYHFHVYTLEKLRLQLSRYFLRETVFQQIASGCKVRDSANAWQRRPRTLQQVPVDIDSPPDSEWWLMSGLKDSLNTKTADAEILPKQVSYPAKANDEEAFRLADGLVLAVNCVPEDISPAIKVFWEQVADQLAGLNFTLVIASTARLTSDSLNVIDIPYELTAFPGIYQVKPSLGEPIDDLDIREIAAWYRCSIATAERSLRVVTEFYRNLLETLKPSAVIGWQSMNPGARLLKRLACRSSIPYWTAERGWIKDTLMFDLCENNFLSEMNRSFALDKILNDYSINTQTVEQLRDRIISDASPGRYPSEAPISRNTFREKYAIPREALVFAFFTHGEPSLNSTYEGTVRELHATSMPKLQTQIDLVSDYFIEKQIYFIIQEHPFNVAGGYCLRVRDSKFIIKSTENIRSLLDAADHYLFTISTIQYEAIFFEKSFGLLSKSSLYQQKSPYLFDDYENVEAFITAITSALDWPEKSLALKKYVAFIYDNFLFDIEAARVEESARRFARHLAKFVRPVDARLPERIDHFLEKWTRV